MGGRYQRESYINKEYRMAASLTMGCNDRIFKHSHDTAGHRGGKFLHHLSNSTLLKKYPAYFRS
jgi:hypothetical protein